MSEGANRPDPPVAAPPVAMLMAYLNFHRATLLWKLDGLTGEQLTRPMTPSGLSLLAIVKHSTYVERSWFQAEFAGLEDSFPWTDDDPDADWHIGPGDSLETITDLYEAEWAKSLAVVAGASWDDVGRGDRARERGWTLGWILGHMLEEKARHNGQADILREAIDGATGE